jgi:hypothetical protein
VTDEGEVTPCQLPASLRRRETCAASGCRAKTHCPRKPEHEGDCRTAEATADSRQRKTDRRRGTRLRDDPVAALGYIEQYTGLAEAYLAKVTAAKIVA